MATRDAFIFNAPSEADGLVYQYKMVIVADVETSGSGDAELEPDGIIGEMTAPPVNTGADGWDAYIFG